MLSQPPRNVWSTVFGDFRYYTKWNEVVNRRNFAAPADPWQVLWVDPSTVEYFNVVSLKWGLGRVNSGDWDQAENYRRVDELAVHEGLYQRFEEGLDWEETTYCEWAAEQIAERGQFRGHSNIDEVLEKRCPTVHAIFEEMRTDGYRPNFEVKYDDPEAAQYIHDLEPFVLIGRDGQILWTEGFHRLVLADLAGIDRVPVYVLVRHEQWQEVRDERWSTPPGGRSPEIAQFDDHPDFQDLNA